MKRAKEKIPGKEYIGNIPLFNVKGQFNTECIKRDRWSKIVWAVCGVRFKPTVS